MRRRRLAWGTAQLACLLSVGMIVSSVHGASFDCAKSKSKTERLVCQSPELSALDEMLAASYRRVLAQADDRGAIRREQRAWLQTRGSCADSACLMDLYRRRIADLDRRGSGQPFTGSWEDTEPGPEGSGMWLDTEQVSNTVKFQLEIANGAPSYNTGWIAGEFELEGNVGHFREKMSSTALCQISFYFTAQQVEVRQGGDLECGFGYGVVAGGVLTRTSKDLPKLCSGDPRAGECGQK